MITVELAGRLGNQMFQYALCRTVAERNGYFFYVSRDNNNHGQNISEYFDLPMGEYDGSGLPFRWGEDSSLQTYNPDVFNISDGTRMFGFFQTEKYFLHNAEKIKGWFKINLDDETQELINKFPTDEYCYVHFRGTDYKNWDEGTRFLPKKYFQDAFQIMKEKKSDLKFLIITDDIESAKEYFQDHEIISNQMLVDFKLLYVSKYCIVTNSSFSWWAAWLSDKEITVAPNNWLNYNMPHLGFYPVDIKTEKFIYI
jgi:hypothetical protein